MNNFVNDSFPIVRQTQIILHTVINSVRHFLFVYFRQYSISNGCVRQSFFFFFFIRNDTMFPYRRYRIETRIFPLDSSTIERNQHENTRPISVQATISSTGITNSVRKHETHTGSTPSTAAPVQIHQEKLEGEDKISFAEPQFYARTSNTPVTNRRQPSPPFESSSFFFKIEFIFLIFSIHFS